MNNEKMKEIKETLECCLKSGVSSCNDCPYNNNNKTFNCNIDGMLKDALNLINKLESENKELRVVTDIANERTYRKKFTDEWRKEYQKELDKQGSGHIAGHPDFDLVYKLYFEQKDRIAELEKENDELASKFIDSYNDSLKDFTEKVKNKLFDFFQDNEGLDGKISVGVLYVDVIGIDAKDGTIISLGLIDKLLKEYDK